MAASPMAGLRAVLDNREAARLREGHDRRHIAGHAEQVRDDDDPAR